MIHFYFLTSQRQRFIFRFEDPFLSFCEKMVIFSPLLQRIPPVSIGIDRILKSTQELIGKSIFLKTHFSFESIFRNFLVLWQSYLFNLQAFDRE